MPRILITGCSTGFGRATAELFLESGWEVVATMRRPEASTLPPQERLTLLPLDVTDPDSIAAAVDGAGAIDVLANNAGFGAPVPVELTTAETARTLFDTNVLGTLAVTQAVLPQMRARRSGVIVNVSSSVTLSVMPVVGVYRASKVALNAMTESLAVEIAPFGLRAHLVLPGHSPETRFGPSARAHLRGMDDSAYAPMMQRFIAAIGDGAGAVTHAGDVARAVWRVATDAGAPFRVAAGADAEALLAAAG